MRREGRARGDRERRGKRDRKSEREKRRKRNRKIETSSTYFWATSIYILYFIPLVLDCIKVGHKCIKPFIEELDSEDFALDLQRGFYSKVLELDKPHQTAAGGGQV